MEDEKKTVKEQAKSGLYIDFLAEISSSLVVLLTHSNTFARYINAALISVV